jgi:uncharacterized membrane protein YGL010W
MSIQDWFDKYAEHHQNPVNKLIHWFCIPAILFSLIGLLSNLKLNLGSELLPEYLTGYMHAGTLLIIFGIFFFSRLSTSITIGMTVVSLLILKGVNLMYYRDLNVLLVSLFIFVIAWIGQFIGHNIEGTKPSFFDDLKFLLIGPAWLLSFIYKKLGIKY